MGYDVYLWSSGGSGYAAHAARVLGVEDVARGCCLKQHPPEGVAVDYAVDDDEGVVEEYGGTWSRPTGVIPGMQSSFGWWKH
jgi:hypothetical protein